MSANNPPLIIRPAAGAKSCPHQHDVAISCRTLRLAQGAPDKELPLPPGAVLSFTGLAPTAPRRGRLEMYSSGKWGTVCNKGFDER